MTATPAQLAALEASIQSALTLAKALPTDANVTATITALTSALSAAGKITPPPPPPPVNSKPAAPTVMLNGSILSFATAAVSPPVTGYDVYIGGTKVLWSNWQNGVPTSLDLSKTASTTAWGGTLPIPSAGASESVQVAAYNSVGEGAKSSAVTYTSAAPTPTPTPTPTGSGYSITQYAAGTAANMTSWLNGFYQALGIKGQFCTGYCVGASGSTPFDLASSQAVIEGFPLADFPIGVWGVNMIPNGASIKTWQSGQYVSAFVALAKWMVSIGRGSDIWRLGWEFNGTWYAWSVYSGTWEATTYAATFVEFWQQVVTAVRAVAPNMRFCWNPTLGDQGAGNMAAYYPGDAYVDFIGLDWYDGVGTSPYPGAAAAWQSQLTGAYGANWYSAFATQHGKRLMLPEWGSGQDTGATSNGGDNAAFVTNISQWCKTNNVYEAGYWASGKDASEPNMVSQLKVDIANFAI